LKAAEDEANAEQSDAQSEQEAEAMLLQGLSEKDEAEKDRQKELALKAMEVQNSQQNA